MRDVCITHCVTMASSCVLHTCHLLLVVTGAVLLMPCSVNPQGRSIPASHSVILNNVTSPPHCSNYPPRGTFYLIVLRINATWHEGYFCGYRLMLPSNDRWGTGTINRVGGPRLRLLNEQLPVKSSYPVLGEMSLHAVTPALTGNSQNGSCRSDYKCVCMCVGAHICLGWLVALVVLNNAWLF